MATLPMFTLSGHYRAALDRPVIAGCRAEDLYQLVSGTLRGGDRIHIYTVDEELGETYLVWEDVMVYQAFDNAGNLIPPQDTVSAVPPASRRSVSHPYVSIHTGVVPVPVQAPAPRFRPVCAP